MNGKTIHEQVIVIGGGAAGFFAAINIANQYPGIKTLILEKSTEVLSKVKVSGGGRCNVTHACFDPNELTFNYPRGEKELLGPFHFFAAGDTISWFSDRNVELHIEEDGRMFPTTNRSQTIIDCFLEEVKRHQITISLKAEVQTVRKNTFFELQLKDGRQLTCEYLIIATGGHHKIKAYELIRQLGHHIQTPIPSLFTFNLPKHESNHLMGISHEATVKLIGTKYEEYGPLLFTHWGMSGPAILKLSSMGAVYLNNCNYRFEYSVEWKPDAESFIEKNRRMQGNKKVYISKPEEMVKRLWHYLLQRAKIDEEYNWADLSKADIDRLQQVLSTDIYQANGKTTFKEEFVTCGGVDLKEVNMKSMESKLISELYFCGEVLNIDALTGGFNFQAAWTTGWLAAQSIVSKLKGS